MPAIKVDHFDGGTNLTSKGSSGPQGDDLAAALRAAVADNTALRATIVSLLAKLDADAGITDTDYASTLTPAALTLTSA